MADINLSPPPGTGPDSAETFVLPYDKIGFQPWGNLPPRSGEMAMLYGDFNQPGPYLVMMKWNPGWSGGRAAAARLALRFRVKALDYLKHNIVDARDQPRVGT